MEKQLFWGWIKIYHNISILNYLSSLVHYFVMTFIFVSIESLQPMLFQERFDIKPRNAGTENGNILLIDILVKCIFAPFVGILSDKIGRKIVLQIGITITAISLILMAISTNIYPFYCIARVVYAVGAITLATIPFVADYVHDSTKGRASALNVVLAALGAVFSATVITNILVSNLQIGYAYIVVSASLFVIGMCYTQGMKPGVYFKDKNPAPLHSISDSPITPDSSEQQIENHVNQEIEKEVNKNEDEYVDYQKEVAELQELKDKTDCLSALKIAVLAGRNIWIFQGYVANFLGRGDSILLTLSLVIWSQQYIPEDALDPDKQFKEANIKAQTLSGATYTVIMVFAFVYGLLFEKASKIMLLLVMFSLTLLGCVLMNFATSPDSLLTYVYMVILGMGMAGLYTAALYLINKYAYREFRGYISGLANVFSVLGIFMCAFVGGVIQDKYKVGPFNLFGAMSFLGLVLVVWSLITKKKIKQQPLL